MAITYPTTIDTLTNPTATSSQATVDHAGQHSDANDAIEALEAKVGVDSSAVVTSLDYRVATLESTEASDVQGPASAVDDRIVTFDGTTGKLIQDGGKTVAELQPIDSRLTSIAGLTPGVEGNIITSDGLGTYQISTANAVRSYLNVEDGADVTDTTNVTAAGALMDSELTSIADVKALDQSVVSGATPTFTNTNFTEATDKNYVTDAQQTVITNTSGTNTGDNAANTTYSGLALNSKSLTIESPTASEDISMFFTSQAITISEIRAVVRGTTPSVTWTIRHGTDRSAAGAEVVTSGTTTTSESTGSDVTSFDDATIVADSFVWFESTAQSGTTDELNLTIIYALT